MDIECPVCHQGFHVAQKHQYHSGFSNEGFLYCDSCPNIVVFSSHNPRYTHIVGNRHPWTLSEADLGVVEGHLKPCPCGGHFGFGSAPRCPSCNATIREILRDSMHYIETGRRFDGDKEDVWATT